jgi:type I restriction enzyme S subunit
MSDKITTSPQIRFVGFTDAWEQVKLKDCFTERSERSAEGELISITINSGVVKSSDLDRIDNSSSDKSNYKVVKVGDIAYNSMRMWQGASGFSPYDGILSPAYTVITPKENSNPKFFAYNFKRHEMIWTFQINSQGLTSDTWNLKFPALSSIKIAVPSYEEQTEIARFFEKLDHQLALHQRELELLKDTKKSLLQKMFPRDGTNVPEIRFAGFTDAWEQRELGKLVDVVRSYSLSRDVETDENSGFRYVHYGDIHKKVADLIESDEQLPKIKAGDYDLLQKGDVIVADASEDYIGIAEPSVMLDKPRDKVVAGLHTIAVRPKEITPLFLYFLLHTDDFKKFGGRVGTGMKVFGITTKNLFKYPALLPIKEEQEKIGKFFYELDNLITLHQTELISLKNLKKSLLQQMFI